MKRRAGSPPDVPAAGDLVVPGTAPMPRLPERLPVLPMRGTVVFPSVIVPLLVTDESSRAAATEVLDGDGLLAVATVRAGAGAPANAGSLHAVGTAVRILRAIDLPNGKLNLLVEGLTRVELDDWSGRPGRLDARIRPIPADRTEPGDLGGLAATAGPADDAEAGRTAAAESGVAGRGKARLADGAGEVEKSALILSAGRLLGRLQDIAGSLPDEVHRLAAETDRPGWLADLVAAHLSLPVADKQEVLECRPPRERLRLVVRQLERQIQVYELSEKIESEVQDEIDRSQRDFYLRERLKAIRRELGEEEDEGAAEHAELARRIAEAGMPEEVAEAAGKELERLARTPPAAAEYNVLRTYLDWLLDLPWGVHTVDQLDLERAARVLDEDHYDLEKVKKRVLEYLAVRRLKPDKKGPILCFIGPPGVGKTSLGRSIARALDRRFVRLSLGGVHDEAEIRGHRRTYVGALPGRIVQGIKKAGSMNPVFMLDEIDKVGADFRGDPSAALLEVLDPEQNHAFSDHFLEVPFDLSRVLFIATGNVPEYIPDALYDRMEILELPGYTAEEKIFIARHYLIPRQLEEHGLEPEQLAFTDETLGAIVQDYTEEAGVRELERQVAAVCRAVARRVAEALDGDDEDDRIPPVEATPADLTGYLGPVKYFSEVADHTPLIGVAIALAWTAAGGDILFIEATRMPGKGELTLTGQLGDVMKESARAALSYLRARATELEIDPAAFDRHDLHVHVPAGAVPKDGPSAGVAMLTALASLFTGRVVHPDLGMTGEITLRGRVLPVGGVKNKVLAARRAGLRRVLLPSRNEKDLEEIPDAVLGDLEFVFVDRLEDVLDMALDGRPQPPVATVREAGPKRRRGKPSTAPPQPSAGSA